MIFDTINNASSYYGLGKKYQDAFEFLKNTDFSSMPAGIYTTTIDGVETKYKIKRYDSRMMEDCNFEKHEKGIDLQYMVAGKEYFGYGPYEDTLKVVGTNPDNDCTYYNRDSASLVIFKEGMFAIAMPGDVHMPELRIAGESVPVIKAIVKLPL